MTRLQNRMGKSGSPVKGEPDYVLIGRLQRAHGVAGEIVLGLSTDFPERIKSGKVIYLGRDHWPRKISGARQFHENLLITMEGVYNREEASELTNMEVFVRTSDLPSLPDGRFYHHQLIGLKAIREDGTPIGEIREIMETGANDVYVVVDTNGHETLLPAIDGVIGPIDLDKRTMVVNPPEWE